MGRLKLDGTFLWRLKSGPNILLGNSSNFAIADFDGDGRCEVVTKTGEGTIFGDGTEIGDTNNDGKTDYRTYTGGWIDHYTSDGPEFFSVIDGATGRELARADFISRAPNSDSWGDSYWKRANSLRLGAASFSGEYPSIFLGRGVYQRTVVEGWDYRNGQLTQRFHFDTSDTQNNNNKDGSTIWEQVSDKDNDTGRCCVADIDPDSPGCEFWRYGSNVYASDGVTDLGYKPQSCNMAIWFDGTLNRQLINAGIIHNQKYGRTFTMYRFDESFNNGTKSNPGWYGDMLGDWREEVILPDQTKLANIKVFTTWYPTEHKFPWLMTDHTYLMSAINENVGYNQPTQTGYYIGSDLKNDAEAWQAGGYITTAIRTTSVNNTVSSNKWYNILGQEVATPQKGIFIRNGKKYIKR